MLDMIPPQFRIPVILLMVACFCAIVGVVAWQINKKVKADKAAKKKEDDDDAAAAAAEKKEDDDAAAAAAEKKEDDDAATTAAGPVNTGTPVGNSAPATSATQGAGRIGENRTASTVAMTPEQMSAAKQAQADMRYANPTLTSEQLAQEQRDAGKKVEVIKGFSAPAAGVAAAPMVTMAVPANEVGVRGPAAGVAAAPMVTMAVPANEVGVRGPFKTATAAPAPIAWRCIPGLNGTDWNVPMRKNTAGQVECMTTGNKNCAWKPVAECEASKTSGLGGWSGCGTAQYNDPNHWCAKGRAAIP
jgi:hypothetical protein